MYYLRIILATPPILWETTLNIFILA